MRKALAEKEKERLSESLGVTAKMPAEAAATRAADGAGASEPRPAFSSSDGGLSVPSSSRRAGPFLAWAIALLVVIGVGAGAATVPMWLPHLKATLPGVEPDPFDSNRVAALAARVQALEQVVKTRDPGGGASLENERARLRDQVGAIIARIESLEQSVDAVKRMAAATAGAKEAAKAQSSLDELSRRLGDLEKEGVAFKDLTRRLQNLEKSDASRADVTRDSSRVLTETIDDLTRRLGAIEKSETRAARGADENRALVLAVSQLREATRGSGSFARELEVVRSLVAGDAQTSEILAELTRFAANGVPTVGALRESFDSTAEAIAQAATRGEGWVERTVDRISSLVTVRRTDGRAEEGSVDAKLAAAEQALKEGDLIAVVGVLSGLSGHAAAVAQPWLDRARGRIAVERALAALHVQAISRLAPPKG